MFQVFAVSTAASTTTTYEKIGDKCGPCDILVHRHGQTGDTYTEGYLPVARPYADIYFFLFLTM